MTSLQDPERKKILVVAPDTVPIGSDLRVKFSDPQRDSTTRIILICSFLLLIAVALGIFVFLPAALEARLSEERGGQPIFQKNTVVVAQAPKSGKLPTPALAEDSFGKVAEARDRIKAEKILGELLDSQKTLTEKAVQQWGGEEYSKLVGIAKKGDEAFRDEQYTKAAALYSQGVDILMRLETILPERLELTIKKGYSALISGDGVGAHRHFTLALAMDPSNDYARRGLGRATHIEQVFELLASAKEHETQQRFEQSLMDYQNAASIDPDLELAKIGINRIKRIIVEQNFHGIMTGGFEALNFGNYSKAKKAFQKARAIKPASKEINEALNQANEGLKIEKINFHKQKAMAAERLENWKTAMHHYTSALALDPDVQFAQQGKVRSEHFVKVHGQLDYYLKQPSRLYSKDPLAHARKLLTFANSLGNTGPKLSQKIASLTKQIQYASTPVSIQLKSDNMTEIAIYKVGRFGTFSTRELMLRPGTYTVVGARPGYRDIRKEIIVDGHRNVTAFVVRCEEPI